ncbi:MAG: glycerate-2-kinase family protein, partial [Nitrospirota bacterium]|nr:glycerate-2-kinase family protein [Nitrospirota bacterium]
MMEYKDTVRKIFFKALENADPESLVKEYAEKINSYYAMNNFTGLIVAGFGKASCLMAKAVEDAIDTDLIKGGAVVTKYGHTLTQRLEPGARSPDNGTQGSGLKKIKVYEAGHPVPDDNGIRATEEIIDLIKSSDGTTLVLCLVSGGGSALLVAPYD